MLRGNRASDTVIRRAVNKAHCHAGRCRLALYRRRLEFPLAHGSLGSIEHRSGVLQTVDFLYLAIVIEGHIENEKPIKNNLVGNIHIACRGDFRWFVGLLHGVWPREADKEKEADY